MKNILIALSLSVFTAIGLNAAELNVSTNSITAPTLSLEGTNSANKGMPMELTLGGGGVTIPKTGETSFGASVSLSMQPFKVPVWVGIAQEFTWEPRFAGSTDLDATWGTTIIKDKLYFNTGWSAGALYDRSTLGWRSGPEVSLEYYTSGNAFIFVGANYDLITKASGRNWQVGAKDSGLRYNFGIGIAF